MKSTEIIGIGLMCGTSQDALDIAAVKFDLDSYDFKIVDTKEVVLPQRLKGKIKDAPDQSAQQLSILDIEVGKFFGQETKKFIDETGVKAEYIASHGITIFHQPNNGFTIQIGSPIHIAEITGIKTISDFRSKDVAKGGQGAPLVPGCDQFIFKQYDYTLNLGGFANISILSTPVLGYDISVCNLALNYLVEQLGLSFDDKGDLASNGNVIPELFVEIERLEFFKQLPPKSLGKEWFESTYLPLLIKYSDHSEEDQLRTVCEHLSKEIVRHFKPNKKCLVTGGGAFNSFLIDLIRSKTNTQIIVPSKELISFKESVCFAFLGLRRIQEKPNVFSSVTGAFEDSCSGVLHIP